MQLYNQRIGTVGPVFANLRHNKRLSRFNYRGQAKVRTRWSPYCMVDNIAKLSRAGLGQIGVQQRNPQAAQSQFEAARVVHRPQFTDEPRNTLSPTFTRTER
ncbi:transposase [Roseateles sp.]|uniref:transposase n=1 Tax=Roseateles sp. TaxID=1971397 RepID=UPI003D0EFB53